MTLFYTLEEQDYLAYQLYTAAQSNNIKRKRRKNRLLVPVLYIILGAALIGSHKLLGGGVLVVLAFLWYFFFPLWERRRYESHFLKHIQENYKGSLGASIKLEFTNEHIHIKDDGTESKVAITEVETVAELDKVILIKLKNSHTLIISKTRIEEPAALVTYLKNLAQKLKVDYNDEVNWVWR